MVGIITRTDLLKVQKSTTGLERRGISFAFLLKDRSGSIRAVTDIIRKYGGRTASVHSSYKDAPEGFREVYVRMYGIDRQRFDELKEELQQKAKLLYVVDHAVNRREIFQETLIDK